MSKLVNPVYINIYKRLKEIKLKLRNIPDTQFNKVSYLNTVNTLKKQLANTPQLIDTPKKQVLNITRKKISKVEQLNNLKLNLEAPEKDDVQIFNPITLNYIKNNSQNIKKIQLQIQKYNLNIQDKINKLNTKNNLYNTNLNMPIINNDDKSFVMPGRYNVSIRIKYDIFNKNGESKGETKETDFMRDITIKTKTTKYFIADLMISNFFNFDKQGKSRENNITFNKQQNTINIINSGFENIEYMNLQIEKWTDKGFSKILMNGKNLGYSLLGDTSIINENENGKCVPEFLYYEVKKQNYRKNLTLPKIIEELEEIKKVILRLDSEEFSFSPKQTEEFINRSGYDARMMLQWAKNYKDISIHVIDPLYSEILKHIPKGASHLTLCFIINNNHCYPIINPEIKNDIFKMHRIDMNKIKFKINDYTNGALMSEDDLLNMDITNDTNNNTLIFVKNDNLKNIVSKIIKETNLIDGAIIMSGAVDCSTISGYKHPTNNTIFIASPDYYNIIDTCNKLNNHFNTKLFEFKNQSWAKIGSDLLNFMCFMPNESVYSAQYLDILEDYKISPYNTKLYPENYGNFETYDISRAYSKVILDNKEEYPIFYLNDPEPYNNVENIEAGEYYINKIFYLGGKTIKQRNGFYPSNIVKYCLENNYITKSDITAKIKARFSLKADYFKNLIETIYKIFPYNHSAAKNLVNHLLGKFGIVEKKYMRGCMTTSFDVACAIKMQHENDHTQISIYNHNDQVYFIRMFENYKETAGHKPIWRHIIAGSIIELDKLYKKVVNVNSTVLGYYTDSIKGYNFNNVEIPKNKYIGCILPETKNNIYGTYINDITENKPFTLIENQQWKIYNESENLDFNNIVEIAKKSSCLINGCAGSGKTEIIKNIVDKNSLVMAFTNKASRDVLMARGVEAQTIDSYFFKNAGDLPYRKLKTDKINRIIIDEISMLGIEKFKILHKIKSMYPDMIFNLLGDFSQCAPVDDIIMDLLNENFIKNMCGSIQCILKYKGTRYDMETYKQLEEFNNTGYMPKEWLNKTVSNISNVNICKTTQIINNTRDKINNECYKKFSIDKVKKIIGNKEYFIDMPIFAITNNHKHKIYNSQKYSIKKFDAENVILNDDNIIPNYIFSVIFNYGFCDSVYRYQGDSINEQYNIYDTHIMNRNELYTALSRCTNINNVNFEYSNKYFEQTKPTKNIIETLKNHMRKVVTGYIYKISFSLDRVYIGQTKQNIQERIIQHREKPTNAAMREAFKSESGKIEVIEKINVTNDEQLNIREKIYIKSYNHLGDKLLNTLLRQEENNFEYKPFNNIDIEIDNGKYKINDNKKGCIKINHDNIQKKFTYGRSPYNEVYQKAVNFRMQLLKRDNGEIIF